MAKTAYDFSNVIRQFLERSLPDQAKLLREIREGLGDAPVSSALMAEIGNAAVDAGSTPVQVLGCGLMYGILLGIYLEKQRSKVRLA